MEKIDKYINSIYRDISDSQETEDLKQEMSDHLKETVKELEKNGVTEEESVRIAIERFGGEFQIRNQLNEVLKFHKLFAKKILTASLIFLVISLVLFTTSFFIRSAFLKRYYIMNSQINAIGKKLSSKGISNADAYFKEIIKGEKNNQLTYIAIKELPQNSSKTKNNYPFEGQIKYSYPQNIKKEYYTNKLRNNIVTDNNKYFLEVGVKNSANTDNSGLYTGLGTLTLAICWVLLIIWSIISVYRYGKLNGKWCTLLILTGILGYFIFSIRINPNNTANNKRNNIIYIIILCFALVALVLPHMLNSYRIARLYELYHSVFHSMF